MSPRVKVVAIEEDRQEQTQVKRGDVLSQGEEEPKGGVRLVSKHGAVGAQFGRLAPAVSMALLLWIKQWCSVLWPPSSSTTTHSMLISLTTTGKQSTVFLFTLVI